MKLWYRLTHLGINEKNLDWDNRNLRIMNGMSVILALSMFMFAIVAAIFEVYEDIPLLLISFSICTIYFFVNRLLGLKITKIYFCVMPIAIVMLFSILVFGEVGNDKYYILISATLPPLVFNNKWTYIPLIWLNMLAFFFIEMMQKEVEPWTVLPETEMGILLFLNHLMLFTFIYAIFQLYKNENAGYQNEINLQKEIVEEKNVEITQSIEYAKRIQQAILPTESFRQQYLPNSFVLYRPKDIVAGDFYWLEKVNDKLFFAAADCTGHGVPGAMVSVVCHNALNQSVHEFELTDPADILNKTRELVIKTFKHSDMEVKDGMDVGLCALDMNTGELQFSGANNSLYLIENSEIQEIKPDKQPIGNYANAVPFSSQRINVSKGSTIYLFTDGFADQFGGEKGKKYKYKPFKQFLEKLQNSDINEHAELINNEFDRWKGDLEQVDDVCIFGVRF